MKTLTEGRIDSYAEKNRRRCWSVREENPDAAGAEIWSVCPRGFPRKSGAVLAEKIGEIALLAPH
jgi:hypothetical protein